MSHVRVEEDIAATIKRLAKENRRSFNMQANLMLEEWVRYTGGNDVTPKDSIRRIVETYYDDEETHYEESDSPNDHVFNDLELVGRWIAQDGLEVRQGRRRRREADKLQLIHEEIEALVEAGENRAVAEELVIRKNGESI